MVFVRGLFWLALMAVALPDLVSLAAAEPRAGASVEATEAASPTAPAAAAAPAHAETPVAVAAPVAPPKPAVTLQAKVDLAKQTLTVLEHGKTVSTWKISSGTEEFATPRGTFQPEWSAKMWYSKKYDDAPMPHAVFFKSGAAIHATQAIGALGRPASHGCVRLAPANAETFYRLVQRHGLVHTRIAVYGEPPYQRQLVASRSRPAERRVATNGYNSGFQGSVFGGTGYGGSRSAQYANASPFAGSNYARLPISAARVR